ncbi:MBL fold metallo-hydrolase [Roseomonas sp. CCTCC AB2023176]|uniref:MBL fold metallo-hydrolase n=1 Tax=Roseomonas sp. CCTCC AB2023176 TaxID=3342640 RepID=UPI0035E1E1AC
MRLHVINCGCMRPYGGRFWDGLTNGLGPARLACRCLVAEADDGLVLVDTGFGLRDIETPAERLPAMATADRPDLNPDDTAVARLRALGHRPEDVRHIVMTHLDFDHAGGIHDFPNATVHVHAFEAAAAVERAGVIERQRYQPAQLPADMKTYDPRDARTEWMGLQALALEHGAPSGILLVPLPGHTRGHCGVAIDTGRAEGGGWVLHAGDAIFMHSELRAEGAAPPLAKSYEAMMQANGEARHASAALLRGLAAERAGEVEILCTHDPVTPPATAATRPAPGPTRRPDPRRPDDRSVRNADPEDLHPRQPLDARPAPHRRSP